MNCEQYVQLMNSDCERQRFPWTLKDVYGMEPRTYCFLESLTVVKLCKNCDYHLKRKLSIFPPTTEVDFKTELFRNLNNILVTEYHSEGNLIVDLLYNLNQLIHRKDGMLSEVIDRMNREQRRNGIP